ncbi:MAG: hypothetical protein WDW36_009467 [Sanguina aurantia]
MLAQLADPTTARSTSQGVCQHSACIDVNGTHHRRDCDGTGELCPLLTTAAHQVWRSASERGGQKSLLMKRQAAQDSVMRTLEQMGLEARLVHTSGAGAQHGNADTAVGANAAAATHPVWHTHDVGGASEVTCAPQQAARGTVPRALFVNGMWVDVIVVRHGTASNQQLETQRGQLQLEQHRTNTAATTALLMVGADCFVRGGQPASLHHHHAIGDLVLLQRRLALHYGGSTSIGVLHEWGRTKGDAELQRTLLREKLQLGPTTSL